MEQMDARYKQHVKQKAGTWFKENEHFMEEMMKDNILSDYFLFVNRDSYLLLSCCDKWEKWNIPEEKIIFADDLLSNALTNIDFAGKTILLYDAVLNVGRKMFNCYCKLTKLGAEKIRPYVHFINVECPILDENIKKQLNQHYFLKILTQIYFLNFTSADINEAYAFLKKFYKEIVFDCFKSSPNMTLFQRNILNIFHEEAYQMYLNGEWNYESEYMCKNDSNFFYEVMEKVRYLVTLSECDKTKEPTIGQIQDSIRPMCNEWGRFLKEDLLCQDVVSKVLEFMQELGIIDIIGDIVSFGQNADWLVRGEGKICYLIYEAFYICKSSSDKYTYDDYLFIIRKYITYFKEELLLYIASEEDRKLFNKTIFDYYVERYQKMDESYVHFTIRRQTLWTYNLKGFEKNVHEYAICNAEYCNTGNNIADMIEGL